MTPSLNHHDSEGYRDDFRSHNYAMTQHPPLAFSEYMVLPAQAENSTREQAKIDSPYKANSIFTVAIKNGGWAAKLSNIVQEAWKLHQM